jgi:hypothetical protein
VNSTVVQARGQAHGYRIECRRECVMSLQVATYEDKIFYNVDWDALSLRTALIDGQLESQVPFIAELLFS